MRAQEHVNVIGSNVENLIAENIRLKEAKIEMAKQFRISQSEKNEMREQINKMKRQESNKNIELIKLVSAAEINDRVTSSFIIHIIHKILPR
ncbi:hypothetical protein LCGC14_1554770 [marine sediment metagenome]|uniref:Uncharacterized protein n=1 Tax=marine sediment metagenome TaxID=412755 RepID=A0A0F9L5G4_9ZZZZ